MSDEDPVDTSGACASDHRDLATRLAHELRNVVAPIRNALQVIRIRGGTDPTIVSMADLIDRQMAAMVELLQKAREAPAQTPSQPPTDERSQSDARHSATATPHRRILVADDSAAVRESITALLHDLGHEVRTAADAKEALDLAERWNPQFVLLDIHMPGPSGLTVARRLRATRKPAEMKLVMMSGIALDEVTRSAAMDAGFDHCLDKAFTLESLQQLLNSGDSST